MASGLPIRSYARVSCSAILDPDTVATSRRPHCHDAVARAPVPRPASGAALVVRTGWNVLDIQEAKKRKLVRDLRWQRSHPNEMRIISRRTNATARIKRIFAAVASTKVPASYTKAQLASAPGSPIRRYINDEHVRRAMASGGAIRKAKQLAHSRKRRAQKAGAEATLTRAEWSEVLAYHTSRCVWCGGPYEAMDHVIPLAAGGPHSRDNVAPACARCNTAKRDLHPLVFLAKAA